MYSSLHQFYTGNEWKEVRALLMLDRSMMCECCGKLIHYKYQAIGHHKIELTMANVNNPEISLNLDNLMLVCNKCHNILHNRFGSKTQHRYLVYGPPLAGKREWVRESANKNDLIINIDDIRYAITGGLMYESSNNTLGDVLAVRDLLLDRILRATKAHNIYVVGGYPYRGEREDMCRRYKLEPVFIEVSKDECMARLEACVDRDKVNYTKYINDWFYRYDI